MQVSTDQLINDQGAVVDTEELPKATAGQTGERLEKVRERAEESLRNGRLFVQAVTNEMQASAQEGMHKVDSQVRANPWTAVGIVAAVSFVAGILLGRK